MFDDPFDIKEDDEDIVNFKKTIDELFKLLGMISFNASYMLQIAIDGDKAHLVNGEALDATRHTLLSIYNCSERACFSDAFTLTRKFRDDIFQYLFIIFVLNHVQGLTNEEAQKYFNDINDLNQVMEGIIYLSNVLSSGSRKSAWEKAVDSWLDNTLSDDLHFHDRKHFDVSKYIEAMKTDDIIRDCFDLHFKQLWIAIDRTLNNYVHTNGSIYIKSNLSNYAFDKKKDLLNQLNSTTRDITVIFLSLLILIQPNYIQSTDYIYSLDMGENPHEGSQFWIAPIIQNFIDTDIVRVSSNLKQFLKDNNHYGMQIK